MGMFFMKIVNGSFESTCMIVRFVDVRSVPGRRSDVNDAMWIAELLAHGLIRNLCSARESYLSRSCLIRR
jgi:hypothetical protein